MNIIGYFIIVVLGMFAGIVLVLFLQGASRTEKEHEIFIKGYKAGLQENKKEIPQKPTEDIYGDKCPVCDKYVWGFVSKMQYCANCGQKIEWGGEDDRK